MADMTSLVSFALFYSINELLNTFAVMINISKIKKTIMLKIHCQIFFSVNSFCLPSELCLTHTFLIWSRLRV